MDIVLMEGLSALVRWLHVIAGIAWIGSSFYFIHLDLSLKPNPGIPDGTQGEAWQVHGGGFYNMVKYMVAPSRLPDHLTWFKWEAYTTWLSGFGLLVVTYYVSADMFFIDRTVLNISPAVAIAISLVGLAGGWLAYDLMCRSALGRNETLLAAVMFVFLVALAYLFTHLFSGRGAFIQMGALIGTIMVANVFFVIIPNQKKVVAALVAGKVPDPALGAQGKQRSVHNNYLTLPVVFMMISDHYPLMFGTRYNWIIFTIVLVIGFLIRHFYNRRHAEQPNPWWTWAVAAIGVAVIAWLSWSGSRLSPEAALKADPHATFAQAQDIVLSRCSMCHAAEPLWEGIVTAPRGVRLDTPEEIRRHARDIEIYAVLTHTMPPDNVTEISDADRARMAAGLQAAK
ncbi:MAG TPA: urate hydroxylase PuuD [Stellaceae bacterium]|nr:urate hydroxylase PuuD [Stellaceae bacterium]